MGDMAQNESLVELYKLLLIIVDSMLQKGIDQ